MTEFYTARCATCDSSILLVQNYEKFGFDFDIWPDLNKVIPCCDNPHITTNSYKVSLEDTPPEIPIIDRVTSVLEDMQGDNA